MDGRPNRRNKAAFSNFSGVAWMEPTLRLAWWKKGKTNTRNRTQEPERWIWKTILHVNRFLHEKS